MSKPKAVSSSSEVAKLPARHKRDSTVISVSPPPEMKPRAKVPEKAQPSTARKKPRASTGPLSKSRSQRPIIPMLAFTPGNQDPQILEELFVRREGLLNELERDVEEFANGGSRRHRLLVGPRGIGKSHLIALLNHRVTTKAIAKNISVHMLPEDLYGITRFADLVDAILNRDPQPRKSNAEAETELRALAAAKPMLILLENLDSVLHAIGTDGVHHLRSAIEDSKILLIATSPLLFDEVQKAKAPLFGFFDTIHLDELSVDDALELMRRVAKIRGDDELLEFLDTPQARARAAAVQALAGGQPRIWMLFTGCLSVQALDELVPLFMESLDDLTPYYQSRVGSLSPQLQQIVMMFCRQGSALSNKAIAEGTGIDERRVATAMKDLERKGYVRKPTSILESVGDERISWWDLREPLMRLSLDVKSSRGKPLRIIVEFLKLWYGVRLLLQNPVSEIAQSYVVAAFSDYLKTDQWMDELPELLATVDVRQQSPNLIELQKRFEVFAKTRKEHDDTKRSLQISIESALREMLSSGTEEDFASDFFRFKLGEQLATAVNHRVDTSTLVDLLSPHSALLHGASMLSIPLLESIEVIEPGLNQLLKQFSDKGESELFEVFTSVVSWMKSRDKADLFNLPVEWRNATEALLHSWVSGVLRSYTHVLSTSPPRTGSDPTAQPTPEIGSPEIGSPEIGSTESR
jgi:DNA-binding Lrp family transcriptional regulator